MISPTTKTVTDETIAKASGDPDSPMTGDQADLLRVLCEEASEPFDASLTQRQALERIEALRDSTNKTL
ncbi:Protein of unknown function [Loktanella sp. DSM 29012]|uniref:DUF3072 domain-containing protein n=1 Tax=Loktanella sp. DSM 29012 TaxID=1881056 RepID=UPI0008AEDAA6|nr:DUF3072 domain-containing protein [Loktanella sp. DSM 29012]SEQ61739.1 Protein of unknown function [Loktanella sp. DSM 29012]